MTISSDRWSSAKLIWTVDAQKALQFKNTYIPYCDMLMAKIHWNDNGKLLLFSKESQIGVLNQIGRDRYIKLPKVNTTHEELKSLGKLSCYWKNVKIQDVLILNSQEKKLIIEKFILNGLMRGEKIIKQKLNRH